MFYSSRRRRILADELEQIAIYIGFEINGICGIVAGVLPYMEPFARSHNLKLYELTAFRTLF